MRKREEKEWFILDGEETRTTMERIEESRLASFPPTVPTRMPQFVEKADDSESDDDSDSDQELTPENHAEMPSLTSIRSCSVFSQASFASTLSVYGDSDDEDEEECPRATPRSRFWRRRSVDTSNRPPTSSAPKRKPKQLAIFQAVRQSISAPSANRGPCRSLLKSSAKQYQPDVMPARESRWHTEGGSQRQTDHGCAPPSLPMSSRRSVPGRETLAPPVRRHQSWSHNRPSGKVRK